MPAIDYDNLSFADFEMVFDPREGKSLYKLDLSDGTQAVISEEPQGLSWHIANSDPNSPVPRASGIGFTTEDVIAAVKGELEKRYPPMYGPADDSVPDDPSLAYSEMELKDLRIAELEAENMALEQIIDQRNREIDSLTERMAAAPMQEAPAIGPMTKTSELPPSVQGWLFERVADELSAFYQDPQGIDYAEFVDEMEAVLNGNVADLEALVPASEVLEKVSELGVPTVGLSAPGDGLGLGDFTERHVYECQPDEWTRVQIEATAQGFDWQVDHAGTKTYGAAQSLDGTMRDVNAEVARHTDAPERPARRRPASSRMAPGPSTKAPATPDTDARTATQAARAQSGANRAAPSRKEVM